MGIDNFLNSASVHKIDERTYVPIANYKCHVPCKQDKNRFRVTASLNNFINLNGPLFSIGFNKKVSGNKKKKNDDEDYCPKGENKKVSKTDPKQTKKKIIKSKNQQLSIMNRLPDDDMQIDDEYEEKYRLKALSRVRAAPLQVIEFQKPKKTSKEKNNLRNIKSIAKKGPKSDTESVNENKQNLKKKSSQEEKTPLIQLTRKRKLTEIQNTMEQEPHRKRATKK